MLADASALAAGRLQDMQGEKMVLNMGPSHPATHGVLRIVLELDGEIITKAAPDIGYLHRGDEKIAENMTYTQFIPYTDRLDYLAPLANNVAYALAVEKLMGIDKQLPPRCQFIRVICCELARISSHLLGMGAFAMDIGAMTVFLHTFTEREKIYNLVRVAHRRAVHDQLHAHRRAVARFAAGLGRAMPQVSRRSGGQHRRDGDVPDAQQDFHGSHAGRGRDLARGRDRLWFDRPEPARQRRESRPAQGASVSGLRPTGVRGAGRDEGRLLRPLLLRIEEMRQSVRIVHQCLDKLPGGPVNVPDMKIVLPPKERVLTKMEELIHHFINVTQGVNAPPGEVYFGAENPKGELGFYINSKGGGTPYRLKIRSPSFVNLSILSHLLPGHMVSDVTAILGSFDFVMGECDR